MKHGLAVSGGAPGWRVKQAGWKWRSREHYRQKETRIEKYNWGEKLLSGVRYMGARYTYLPLKLKYDPTAS